jgi:hypothetical protein
MNKFRFLLVLFLGLSAPVFAQTIMSISPSSVTPGSQDITKDIVVRTVGTHFKDGVTKIDFGDPGIIVKGFKVMNQELGNATILISKELAPGPRTIKITTGTEEVIADNLFEIMAPTGELRAVMDVIPNPSVSLGDFDTKNPQGSPLLFIITIYNNSEDRALLHGELTITGDIYGKVASGIKIIPTLGPNNILRFDNKSFDKYQVDRSNEQFFKAAVSNGVLPSDVYTYSFSLYDDHNTSILTVEDKNVVENVIARPELIYPGGEMSNKPEDMQQKFPMFQWFSQATDFDIAIYPVNEFQKTPEEVVLNRPVYQQKGLKTSTFMYPASAEALREGQVYAWQVTAYQQTSKGRQALKSNVFWFKLISNTQVENTITSIEISPDDVDVEVKTSQKFSARALNDEGKEVPFKPEWKVIPSNMGTIDQTGTFTANSIPGTAAIVVKYGPMEEYITVMVTSQLALQKAMNEGFLKELFGLPK